MKSTAKSKKQKKTRTNKYTKIEMKSCNCT